MRLSMQIMRATSSVLVTTPTRSRHDSSVALPPILMETEVENEEINWQRGNDDYAYRLVELGR